MKPATINRKAKGLLDNSKIGAILGELRAALQARHEVTVDSLTMDLEADRQLARQQGQAGAAVGATLGKAKLHGLLKAKQETTGTLTIKWEGPGDSAEVIDGTVED